MRFLITGAGGQLGKEWVRFFEVNKISFSAFNSSELDITNNKELENKLKDYNPNVIINCAAYTKVDDAEENELLASKINSDAVKYLAEYCKNHSIKLVHFSTDYVFPGTEQDRIDFPNGYPEGHQRNPINEYGSSKYFGELAIEESGCEFLLIRVSWLCGRFGNNFVKTMLRLGNERDQLNVVDDQFGSPTFTDQVVKEVYQLLQQNQFGIFHSTSNGLITWYEFAKEIFAQSDIEIHLNPVSSSEFKTKAKRPSFSKLSTEKISKIEGIEIVDWKVGLKNLLEYVE
jgi:dTDP-4-dehydrorhamnose reductase